MKKLKVDLTVLLPGVPDEQDHCVQRMIDFMQGREGIQKVHVVHEESEQSAQLCFHYDPTLISLERVRQLARQTGAELTDKYEHLVLNVDGIRHSRHARLVEGELKNSAGIMDVAVSGTGIISLEYDRSLTTKEKLIGAVIKTGLRIHDKEQPHEHKDGEEHTHAHGGIFGKNSELIFSILSGALTGIGFGISFIPSLPAWVSIIFYGGAYFFGGFYVTKEAIEAIRKGEFEIDFLMLVAAIGAAILGEWAEGALLLFLFSLGHALEHFALNKAKKSIEALAQLAPKTALVKKGERIEEIPIEALKAGDIIIAKPNTTIAADGIIVQGSSSINQAPITGESMPVDKIAVTDTTIDRTKAEKLDARYKVFAGSINGSGSLEIKVLRQANDSTIARLVKMVNEAQTQKSPTQRFTDRFEKIFVPSVLLLVVLSCFAFLIVDEPFSKSFYRAMAVLVAASPCALAISTPSAVLSGIARAARAGVLIKGGRPLEDLGALTAIAFDKTGTLTEGKPSLTHIIPLEGIDEQGLLKIVIAVEQLSDHPLAAAIVRDGKQKLGNITIPQAAQLEAVAGMGIKAMLGDDAVLIGNLKLFDALDKIKPGNGLKEKVQTLEAEGNTTMIVRKEEKYIGVIAVMDTPRKEARQTLINLKEAGIRRMIMLTGDNQQVAETVAKEIGITDAWGSLLPEQKVDAIKKLKKEETRVAMVGDGVNDAPAMANSTVGIAMGAAGSDVALETADIALMGDKLSLLPFAIGLSRQSKKIIRQNLIISLGMVALLIPLTLLGIASIGPAVMAHEGSTLVVVGNALRLLAYRERS